MLRARRSAPVRSWKTKPSPFEEKTNGMSSVSAYSSACCIPSPTLWLLSFASMRAMRDVRLVVEDVVGALGLAAGDQLAADDDAALGEADFLADLRHLVPAGPLRRRA